jgi:uncharacterized membrane protein
MTMRTHELHPALVHAPLALLPTAAIFDLAAAASPRWAGRGRDHTGRTLWWATATSGLVTGLAGMAASQEIELSEERARDMMFLHGIGNFTLVLAAFGVAAWRSANRATYTSALTGLMAAGAATYTAYLGGVLVYTHGAGVKRLGGAAAEAPALFSARGAARLGRDAARGLAWLLGRAGAAVTGRQRVDRTALGPVAEMGSGAEAPTSH